VGWDVTDDHPERRLFEVDVDDVCTARKAPTLVCGEYERDGQPRMDLLGVTAFDRPLFVTVEPTPHDAARPVSARDMEDDERDAYRSARRRLPKRSRR